MTKKTQAEQALERLNALPEEEQDWWNQAIDGEGYDQEATLVADPADTNEVAVYKDGSQLEYIEQEQCWQALPIEPTYHINSDFPATSVDDVHIVYLDESGSTTVTRREPGQDAGDYLAGLADECGMCGQIADALLLSDAIYRYMYVRARECTAAEIAADTDWDPWKYDELCQTSNMEHDWMALVRAVRTAFGDAAGDAQAALKAKYQHFVVAVPSASIDGTHYARHHVDGCYSVWNVKVDMENGDLISVRLRAANCDKPSAKALQNYTILHEAGII